MGKHKRKKTSKEKDKHPEDEEKISGGDPQPKTSTKRGHTESGKIDQKNGESQSPKPKNRKVLEVTVNATNASDTDQTKNRSVIVRDDNNNANPSNSDNEENVDKTEAGIRTRSSGNLTEEEMRLELPEGRKIRMKSNGKQSKAREASVIKDSSRVKEGSSKTVENSQVQKGHENAIIPEDGLQLQSDTEDGDLNATSESGGSTTEEETSDESSSSSSEDEKVVRKKNGKSKRAKSKSKSRGRARYRSRSGSSSSSDSSSDTYHRRLLKDNPGLKDYVNKRKVRQKRAKTRRIKKKAKKSKRSKNSIPISQSPSGETIYSRILPKVNRTSSPQVVRQGNSKFDDAVAKGIERIRLQDRAKELSVSGSRESSTSSSSGNSSSDDEERDRAIHKAAEDMILNSEKFKATATVLPEGKPYDYNDDGDFMMSTCHVESTIEEKAKLGKFVELEKLRNKSLKELMNKDQDQYRLNVMTKEGQSYLVAAAGSDKDNKINSWKKWEQAFKVYMILYTQSNPSRAPEILNYADIIANAAQTFVWENVAMYDFYFRRLMDKHPNRSWARTHTQLWSLTMKDHLNYRNQMPGGSKTPNSSGKSLKELCCWRYNKGKCTRGDACRFEHRCSSCGSYSHIQTNCPRRFKKSKDKDNKNADKKEQGDTSTTA